MTTKMNSENNKIFHCTVYVPIRGFAVYCMTLLAKSKKDAQKLANEYIKKWDDGCEGYDEEGNLPTPYHPNVVSFENYDIDYELHGKPKRVKLDDIEEE